jgi:hypothetical protein
VRNFIRIGKYMDYVEPSNPLNNNVNDDNSSITVLDSAVAQCLQVFGKK